MAGNSTRCAVKLTSTNYLTWSQEMTGIFIVNKCQAGIVPPDGKRPNGLRRGAGIAPERPVWHPPAAPEKKEELLSEVEEEDAEDAVSGVLRAAEAALLASERVLDDVAEEKNMLCLALLTMNVSSELLYMVDMKLRAWQVWENLESLFMGSVSARMQQFRADIHDFSLKKGEALFEAGARLGRLAALGASLGVVLLQIDMKATFLDAVCKDYDWGPNYYQSITDDSCCMDELVSL